MTPTTVPLRRLLHCLLLPLLLLFASAVPGQAMTPGCAHHHHHSIATRASVTPVTVATHRRDAPTHCDHGGSCCAGCTASWGMLPAEPAPGVLRFESVRFLATAGLPTGGQRSPPALPPPRPIRGTAQS